MKSVINTKTMKLSIYLSVVCLCTLRVNSEYQWIVTEADHYALGDNGYITPVMDGRFLLKNSADIINFLEQDIRWNKILDTHQILIKKGVGLNSQWARIKKEMDIGYFLNNNTHCRKSVPLDNIDWHSTHVTMSQGISRKDYKIDQMSYDGQLLVPDCKKISSLIYSMFTFEHLHGMQTRENLVYKPELLIAGQVDHYFHVTMDQFGHWVATVLKQNTSSWLHYDLASLYWRYKGNPSKAMECSRRAVLHAPRAYKDITLLNMGTILYNTGHTADALIVLESSLEHNVDGTLNHLMMGHAHAVEGNFQSAIKHYNMSLRIKPDFPNPVLYRHASYCIEKLLTQLNITLDLVKPFTADLGKYCEQDQAWFKSHATFLKVLSATAYLDYRSYENNIELMIGLLRTDINATRKEGDRFTFIHHMLQKGPNYVGPMRGVYALSAVYFWKNLLDEIARFENRASEFVIRSDEFTAAQLNFGPALLVDVSTKPYPSSGGLGITSIRYEQVDAIKRKESQERRKEAQDKKKQSSHTKSSQSQDDHFEYALGQPLYPVPQNINRQSKYFDVDPTWPRGSFCKEVAYQITEAIEAIYPVFLPFENKGLRLNRLLTDKIGVPATVEHELPWHPPLCPNDKDFATYTQKKYQKPQIGNEIIKDVSHLRLKLLEYVGDGDTDLVKNMQDAEIGQRIHSAMQMNLAPKWMLYTLASLYWRVRSNKLNALNCLLAAKRLNQNPKYRDIVLVSLASVFLELGIFDEACTNIDEAFKINLYEPATNFILAEVNMINKNGMAHMFHLKTIGRLEPDFMNGVAKQMLDGWACLFRQVELLLKADINTQTEDGTCTEVELGAFMRCNKEGKMCLITGRPCMVPLHYSGTSELIRLMKENTLEDDSVTEASLFDPIIEKMPTDPTDVTAHLNHFEKFIKTVEKALLHCADLDCTDYYTTPTTIARKKCDFDQDLGFWLQLITFTYLMDYTDFNKITKEVPIITPTVIKEPECQLNGDPSDNYFLDKMLSVDTEDWYPIDSLIHYHAGLYEVSNFTVVGAKLARYMETRPRSWLGALGAGLWCGAKGSADCAVHCFTAAYKNARKQEALHVLRAFTTMLHMQRKENDAKDIALMAWYLSPKTGVEAFFAGIAYTNTKQYDPALWMYRFALSLDKDIPSAAACVDFTRCLRDFAEGTRMGDTE